MLLFPAFLIAVTGCRAPIVAANIVNQGPAIRLLEFDYPSASFGVDALAAGAQYHYRFAIQGPGPLSLQFQDSHGKDHTSHGPNVDLGQEGNLTVTIDAQNRVTWNPQLTAQK